MKAWRELGSMPRPVWVVFGATLVNRAGSMALPFLVLYLTNARGFSAREAGAMIAVYGVAAFFAGPLAGWMVARFSAPAMMRGSLILAGASQLLVPFCADTFSLAAVIALWAAGSEGFRPASFVVIADAVEAPRRRQAFAVVRLAINLGMSIGPAVGGFLAAEHFAALFWIDGATSLLAAALLWVVPLGPATPAAPATVPAGQGRVRALGDARYMRFLLCVVMIAAVFYQGESSMALYLVQEVGLAESTYGLLFTFSTVLIVLFEIPLTSATAGWSYPRLLSLGALLMAMGFGALAAVSGAVSAAVTVAVWTFGEMLLFPAASAYVTEVAPPAQRGAYLGLYNSAWTLALGIGPWLGTVSYSGLSSWAHWLVVGALGGAAATGFFRWSRVGAVQPGLAENGANA